jgi:hypothetical protein
MAEREYDDSASITPTGMSRSYGQQRQASRRNPDRVRQTQQAILPGGEQNFAQPVGGGYKADLAGMAGGVGPGTASAAADALGGGAPPIPMTPNGMSREQRDGLQWGNKGSMSGFAVGSDYGGDLKARNSMKNTFGKLASQFESSPEGLRQLYASEAFRQAFPGAQLVDHATDPKLDFGGMQSDFEEGVPVGLVDVLKASGAGGWQWLDEQNQAQQMPLANNIYQQTQQSILTPQQGAQAGFGGMPQLDENTLAVLLQQLMQQAGGVPNFSQGGPGVPAVPDFQF